MDLYGSFARSLTEQEGHMGCIYTQCLRFTCFYWVVYVFIYCCMLIVDDFWAMVLYLFNICTNSSLIQPIAPCTPICSKWKACPRTLTTRPLPCCPSSPPCSTTLLSTNLEMMSCVSSVTTFVTHHFYYMVFIVSPDIKCVSPLQKYLGIIQDSLVFLSWHMCNVYDSW